MVPQAQKHIYFYVILFYRCTSPVPYTIGSSRFYACVRYWHTVFVVVAFEPCVVVFFVAVARERVRHGTYCSDKIWQINVVFFGWIYASYYSLFNHALGFLIGLLLGVLYGQGTAGFFLLH